MKDEVRDIAHELLFRTTPASLLAGWSAWWSGINWTTALAGLLVVLQILYLARKWYREESEWAMRVKRWAAGHFTKPADLE